MSPHMMLSAVFAIYICHRIQTCSYSIIRQLIIVTVSLRIAGFVGFVHSPVFQKLENTEFRNLDLFPSSGGGKELRSLFDLF
jgi:fucose 4-O-acetylase-like acetyltransferase